jgi:hypothetical protein
MGRHGCLQRPDREQAEEDRAGVVVVALDVGIWAMFLEPVTGVRTFVVPFRLLQALGTATLVACAISDDRRFHAVATILVAILITIAITLTRFRLGQIDLRM